MTTGNSIAAVSIEIDDTEQPLLQSSTSSLTRHPIVLSQEEEQHERCVYETEQQHDFEKDCLYNMNHQYEHWKTNDWGKSPICIPDALDVNEKWFTQTLDSNATDYEEMAAENKETVIKGNIAKRAAHTAFQRSTIGGMLIHGLDLASLRKKLSESDRGIPEEIISSLKSLADKVSFGIDVLFFHPIYGIIILECEAFNIEEGTGRAAYSNAMRQIKENTKVLFELFKILIGSDCPAEFVHYLLCIPNSKKNIIEESEQLNILDRNDLEDNVAFEDFWKKRSALREHQVGCFTNEYICRFIAIIFGIRSALFTSFCRNALEIHRMVDQQENSRQSNRSLTVTANIAGQHSTSGRKTIFLNSEQISAYEKAKCVSSMLLYGPPGCGKTLLIMNLAKESAEQEKPGRVVVILPYTELIEIYHKFFTTNRSNQKRTIVINPSAEELQCSMADDSADDIFADEVLGGGWINPKAKRNNGQIITGVTIGRNYDKEMMRIARDSLVNRLRDADFSIFELKTVMRNTGNICDYYKRFNPDNQITIGHNIQGRNVKEYNSRNIDSACLLILNHIKQYLNTSDCTSNDIAVLIAHEPVFSQIEKVRRSLHGAGIKVGSVVEQFQVNNTKTGSLVAVDCSANVLSCEWPIVFVIDARECPLSKSVANPIVACSRAVSSLFVINTQECQYPFLKYFCKKYFAAALFVKERSVHAFELQELFCDINLNPLPRSLLPFVFMIPWFNSFFVFPNLLLIGLIPMWSAMVFETSNIKINILLGILGLQFLCITVLCTISSVLCLEDEPQSLLRTILKVLTGLSMSLLIPMVLINGDVSLGIRTVAFTLTIYSLLTILSLIFYILSQSTWSKSYVKDFDLVAALLFILTDYQTTNIVVSFITPLIFFTVSITMSEETNLSNLLPFAPLFYISFKMPLHPKHFKTIIIDPIA